MGENVWMHSIYDLIAIKLHFVCIQMKVCMHTKYVLLWIGFECFMK